MEDINALLFRMQVWCGRQERCTQDVRMKLDRMGHGTDIQQRIIKALEEEKYLDDERFAIAYAEGKSRLKKWGPMKIRAGLRLKRLPSDLVDLALNGLVDEDLHETMMGLLEQHWPRIKGKDLWERKSKAVKFLMGKGYAYGAAMKALEAWSQERYE